MCAPGNEWCVSWWVISCSLRRKRSISHFLTSSSSVGTWAGYQGYQGYQGYHKSVIIMWAILIREMSVHPELSGLSVGSIYKAYIYQQRVIRVLRVIIRGLSGLYWFTCSIGIRSTCTEMPSHSGRPSRVIVWYGEYQGYHKNEHHASNIQGYHDY